MIKDNTLIKENIEKNAIIRNLVIFSLVAIGAGWLGRLIDSILHNTSQQSLGMLLWLVVPACVSLFLRAFAGDKWGDFGIKPLIRSKLLWYLFSVFFLPLCIIIILMLGTSLGVISFKSLNSANLNVLVSLPFVTLVPNIITNIIEEIAFRGYLAPKINVVWDRALYGHVYVGLVWGLWHLPYFSFVTSYTTESYFTLIPRFILGTISVSILLGELRILTKSFWPAVIFQIIGGAVLTPLLSTGFMQIKGNMDIVFSPTIEGGLSSLFMLLVGLSIYMRRIKKQNEEPDLILRNGDAQNIT